MNRYFLDSESGIWCRPGFTGIEYSDGREVEERILSVVEQADDCSVFSEELRQQIVDWPTEYHFSRQRHCLLRPLQIQPGDRVLELGCGCGAITRYLGEIGARVVAVEGGARRARIAARRCRDLENVRVVLDNLVDFTTEERFDWVLLIGVLEYAPLFAGEDTTDPVGHYLESASSFLSDHGRLVVAIENQLGLKYFNGCSEDHLARPFFGIHDLYDNSTPVTFGKEELQRVFHRSGLTRQEFFYPWPDYKLPLVILHDSAHGNSDLNISDLLLRCSARDYTGSYPRIFSEQFVLPVLERNNLLEDLANSFLVVAWKENLTPDRHAGPVAWMYACSRRKQFCTETLVHFRQGALAVKKRRLRGNDNPVEVNGSCAVVHRCGIETYLPGTLLAGTILRQRYASRSVAELAKAFLPWFDLVREHALCEHDKSREWLEAWSVPGEYVDATPFNTVRCHEGEVVLFDKEWAVQGTIPLGWLLYRAVIWGWFGTIPDRPGENISVSVYNLIASVAGLRGLRVRPGSLRQWDIMEQAFQETVSGIPAGVIPRFLPWQSNTCFSDMAEQRSWLELVTRDNETLEKQLAALYGSASWQYSRVFRMAGGKLRKLRTVSRKIVSKAGSTWSPGRFRKVWAEEGLQGIRLRLAHLLHGEQEKTTTLNSFGVAGEQVGVNNYARWVQRYDTLTPQDRATLAEMVGRMEHPPLLSILMPVFDPPVDLLREALESVCKQVYPNWQLCIADDASTDKSVRDVLESYARADKRITIAWRKENGHISKASNTALALAEGEFIVLMDQDDLLPPHALSLVAEAIVCHPDVQMLYSDEDKIDRNGVRHTPSFKCDWNLDLFLSYNYFSHLGVYRRSLVRRVGGFRPGFEGAQDYDLALRCVEKIRPNQIIHIPHILYHWRVLEGSTSLSTKEKPYALAAGKKALEEYLQRNDCRAQCEQRVNSYRIRYEIPSPPPLVSVIVPVHSDTAELRQCLTGIITRTDYPAYELILVDTVGLDSNWLRKLKKKARNRPIRCVPAERPVENGAAFYNFGATIARGEMIALLHDDVQVISSLWLEELVSHGCREGIGTVGARLWSPDGTLQHGGIILGIRGSVGFAHRGTVKGFPGYRRRAELIQDFSAVSGACMLIKKELFDYVGGFDEGAFADIYYDVDFCLKLSALGFRHVWTPYAELSHAETSILDKVGANASRLSLLRAQYELVRRWGEKLQNDPAYNPNLSLEYEDFSLAWPPRRQWLKRHQQVG